MRPVRQAALVHVCVVLIVFSLLFATHTRWIFTHFSGDAYLEDSGWLAYLLLRAARRAQLGFLSVETTH